MDAVAVSSDCVNELQDAMMQKLGENKEKPDNSIFEVQKV